MSRKQEVLLLVPILVLAMAPQLAARAEAPPPAAVEWVPSKAIVVLNVSRPKAVWDVILQPELVKAVESSAAYKAQAAKPDFRQMQNMVKSFERQFQADWQTIVRRLTGGGVTWAVGPGNASLLIMDALDPEIPNGLHDLVVSMVRADAEKKGLKDRVRSMKHGDVTIWTLGPNEAHAIVGKRLLISNRPEALKAALDLRGEAGGKSVASLPAYRQARQAAAADAAAVLYVDTAVVKKLPKLAKALATEKNPLLSLLAAPITEAFGDSSWLALSLKIKGDTLTFDGITDGAIAKSGAARFALPAKAGDGAAPHLAVPRRIAAMSVYRDLAGFYAAKDALFPERTSGLIFFENMMGIFFTGRDLTSEVLAEIGPKIRLVVAEQKYDKAIGAPAVQFPAFAMVLPLKNPKRFAPVAEEAWQKALGLINFTRGQKAQPGLVLDRFVHDGTKYSVAAFSPPTDEEAKPLDSRFNFRPAIAVSHGHLILSSTDVLAEDLMDALGREAAAPVKPQAVTHSTAEIDGPQLASILTANRENLVRQNMIDKGNTREQAEGEVGIFLSILRYISRVGLAVNSDKDRSGISLQIQLSPPSSKRGGK